MSRRSERHGHAAPPQRFLDRYEPIAPPGFREALSAPLQRTIRLNTLKTDRESFLAWAKTHGWHLTALPWYKDAFHVDRDDRSIPLGHTLPHFTGRIYVQEASSMIPPLLLGAQPGERVLDMAAAPGSKTTQLAAMMQNKGLLVANDSSVSRLKALTANLERCGTCNTVVTNLNGHRLGRITGSVFDRVLLDAPCTAEGTAAKSPEVLRRWSENAIKKLATLQSKLLAAAWLSLKPGGTLVYSTCTFAPEENEGVISDFLAHHPEADILATELDGLPATDGLTSWGDRQFDSRLALARRIWPGDSGMEGFFIVVLRKDRRAEGVPTAKVFQDRRYGETVETPAQWLEDRFGFPVDWDCDFAWRAKDAEFWLMSPEAAEYFETPIVRRGLRAARTVRGGYKPTLDFMQLHGGAALRSVLDTNEHETRRAMAGEDLPRAADPGYLALRNDGMIYAVGLGQETRIKNQIPVSRRVG